MVSKGANGADIDTGGTCTAWAKKAKWKKKTLSHANLVIASGLL